MAGIYNFPDLLRGDTFTQRNITLQQGDPATAIDLTGATVRMYFKNDTKYIRKSNGNGLTVSTPTNGIVTIDAFKFDFAGKWEYDLEVEFSDGTIQTFIKGYIKVLNDTTI